MGRLTDDMTRLVGEIHAARDDRGWLLRDLRHATVEMKRAVAHLRSTFAADLAGARAAWFGATAPVSREAGEPGTAPLGSRWEAEAEREDVLREAAEERRRREAERRGDETRTVRKARGRHRPR